MRAMVLTGIRSMEMQEVPDPTLQNKKDVLIRMTTVGVCGSDVHYYVSGKIGTQVVKFPFPVGHEGAGIVQDVGADVTGVKPGDRIAIEPAMPCWTCDQCLAGRPHTCRNLSFLGCPDQADGCLTEKIVMPESSCFKISESMTLDEAALSEPLSIGVYAVQQSIPMQDATVGILGAGPIGLSVLLPAKAQGAKKIYVTDKLDERLALARQVGASWTGNPNHEDVVATVHKVQPDELDVVFECCGQQEALTQAIGMLKPGGKLMIVGIPQVEEVSFSISQMRHKEITIRNVRRQCHCVQPALDMIDNKALDVAFMVTHRFPFEKTQDAFDLVADYRDGVIKAVIDFPQTCG